jgi:hypothetical protein
MRETEAMKNSADMAEKLGQKHKKKKILLRAEGRHELH